MLYIFSNTTYIQSHFMFFNNKSVKNNSSKKKKKKTIKKFC
jgi:hypothetical protein